MAVPALPPTEHFAAEDSAAVTPTISPAELSCIKDWCRQAAQRARLPTAAIAERMGIPWMDVDRMIWDTGSDLDPALVFSFARVCGAPIPDAVAKLLWPQALAVEIKS